MKLSGTQIHSFIEKKGDERVEFKRASSELPDNIWETYSAFCNTDGITRIDDTPVHKALREVLANALIHADYHGRRGIVVEKHFRTITFSNPGTMRGVSKSVAVAGGTSDARNSAIFNIFALVDIGERSGMGLANLHGLWKKYGYAEPKITESYDPDRTVLVVTTDDDTETRPEKGTEPDQNPTNANSIIWQDFPASCHQVYEALRQDAYLTYRGMVAKLGLNKDTINTAVGTLVRKGIIRRVGPKKGGHWEVMP